MPRWILFLFLFLFLYLFLPFSSLVMMFHFLSLLFVLFFLPSVVFSADVLLTQDQMQTMLNLHNGARQNTVPPGGNLAALFWSFGLASDAADFAASCPISTNARNVNVAWALRPQGSVRQSPILLNPIDAFRQWQSFGSLYNFNSRTCSNGPAENCAPYLKVVQDYQRFVGCAARACTYTATRDPLGVACPGNSCSADVYVCVYSSSADYDSAPYAQGLQCSSCPGDRPFCSFAVNNGLSPTGGLCTDLNGLLLVGQEPGSSVFFGRRSSDILVYIGMGVGLLGFFAMCYYAHLVRGWYNSGETKLSPRREEGSKYERVAVNNDASAVPMTRINNVSPAQGAGGRGPPPLPSGKPAVLPPNWQVHKDAQGRAYYYNTVTGASQWTLPQ